MDSAHVPDTGSRRQFSLSLLFHPVSKRTSCIPDPHEPTCQERSHYPVFNPQDPRHNPEASIFPWRRQESSTSSSESPPHRPVTWVHSISRRSFHKARSGLLAIRAGVRRRSTLEDESAIDEESRSFVSPVALRRERQGRNHSSGAYTTSTQEDLGFGIEMYRMSMPPSSPTSGPHLTPMSPSETELFMRETLENPSLTSISQEQIPPLVHTGSPGREGQSNDRTLVQGSGGPGTEAGYTHPVAAAAIGNRSIDDILMEPPREEHQGTASQPDRLGSHSGDADQAFSEQDRNQRFSPDRQRASRACSSSTSTKTTSKSSCSDHLSNNEADRISERSAEVLFAFPGIYQEIMEQWARERGSRTPNASPVDAQPTCSVIRDSRASDPPSYQISEEYHARGEQAIDTSETCLPDIPYAPRNSMTSVSERPMSSHIEHLEESPSSERSTTYEPIPAVADSSTARASLLPRIEIPQRQSHVSDYGTFAFAPRAPALLNQAPYAYEERGGFGYLSSECANPLFTSDSSTSPEITSAEMTSMASMSSDPWSPLDCQLVFPSPASARNEFFAVDGKTSSQYPDQGNQPVKSTYCIGQDIMNTQDHLNRPEIAQNMGAMISQMFAPLLTPDRTVQDRVDFEDEFTDDEFYPGGYLPPAQFH